MVAILHQTTLRTTPAGGAEYLWVASPTLGGHQRETSFMKLFFVLCSLPLLGGKNRVLLTVMYSLHFICIFTTPQKKVIINSLL